LVETDVGAARNSCWEMESKVPLPTFLVSTECSVECSEYLDDAVLTTELTMGRKLDSKGCFGVVISMQGEAFPTGAVGTAVLKFWGKLLDPYEVLIGIFVLCVLTGDFDLVYFAILEFRQIMAENC